MNAEAPSPFIEAQHTLDLPALAQIRRGEEVRVQPIPDAIDELYEQTMHLLPVEERREGPRRRTQDAAWGSTPPDGATDERRTGRSRRTPSPVVPPSNADALTDFIPDTEVLRERYLLAQAVGGYESLHDLLNPYSPGLGLARKYARKVKNAALSEQEVAELELYQAQLRLGLEKAKDYLANESISTFSREEIHELHDLLSRQPSGTRS